MTAITTVKPRTLALPNDQDASGRSLGDEELGELRKVIMSGTLTSTKGTAVKALEQRFADMLGCKHAIACASGTAAIHAAVAAVNPEPGDEVITSPITDMGAIAPILYQSAVPVFADVERRTLNVTAETIAARLSERTRAIIVTHLFGCPADMEPIMATARAKGISVIEDCAQAYLARSRGRLVGTIGDIGCFSLQQGKHITSGEGGIVVTDDDTLARHVRLFVNKAWGYGDPKPDHYFLALNYRLTELQGAVALAQLDKLDAGVAQRVAMAGRLTSALAGTAGLTLPGCPFGAGPSNGHACSVCGTAGCHTFWRYCLMVDEREIRGGSVGLANALKAWNIAAAPRYIQKPAFRCEIFAEQRTFGNSRFPFTLARPEAVDYAAERFPGTFQGLEQCLVLPWNERFTEEHIDEIANAIRIETAALSGDCGHV